MASNPQPTLYFVRFTTPGTKMLTYCGVDYDMGQLLELREVPMDEVLVRLGFVAKVDRKQKHLQAQCGSCGAEFVSEPLRDAHGRLRHRRRFYETHDEEYQVGMETEWGIAAVTDASGDADERALLANNPLFLDKTKASQQ